MPEFAKLLSLFAASLKEQRNSKSLTVPLVQIRNVLPLAGFSGVVWPVIAPSLTDHNRGSPIQPVRSLPLKMLLKSFSAERSSSKARRSVSLAAARRKLVPLNLRTPAATD